MPIPSRQIGWSTQDNLLWQIAKQMEQTECQLCDVNKNIQNLIIQSDKVYGSFYDTTDQTGTAGVPLTMTLNNSDPWNNGVSLVSGSRITLATPGVYNVAFSAQIVKISGNSNTHVHIWLSQNGTDVPWSASQIGLPSNSVYIIAAWNFFVETTAPNEYVQLKWEINSNLNNQTFIKSTSGNVNYPNVPGLIVTVNKVS